MSAGRVWLGLWLVGVAAAGGFWWNQRAERLEQEGEVAKDRARQVALRQAWEKDDQRLARARSESEKVRGTLAELEKAASAARKPGQVPSIESAGRPEPPKDFSKLVKQATVGLDRPESQVRWFASRRTATRRLYAPLFRGLNLDDAQREAFVAHKAKLDESNSDLNAAAHAQGFDINDPAIVKLRGEFYSSYEKAQRELLGETGYRELKEFERTSGARDRVGNLAGLAAVSGLALTPVQADQLVRAIAEASPAYRKGGNASIVDLDWPALEAAMGTILSAEQRTLFATQEAPGSGLFFARWNVELLRATRAEKAKTAPKP